MSLFNISTAILPALVQILIILPSYDIVIFHPKMDVFPSVQNIHSFDFMTASCRPKFTFSPGQVERQNVHRHPESPFEGENRSYTHIKYS